MQPTSNPGLSPPSPSLLEQVQARREQLERGLTADTVSASTRADIEAAIAAVVPMLTGDLSKLPDMVSRDLARWLEANKYIGVTAAAPTAPRIVVETSTPTVDGASPGPAPTGGGGAKA